MFLQGNINISTGYPFLSGGMLLAHLDPSAKD